MHPVIDFHVHAFPKSMIGPLAAMPELRRKARSWLGPISGSMHHIHSWIRYLPSGAARGLEELTSLAPISGLLVESTLEDLEEAMRESGVARAVLIAHPPYSTNEFVLDACSTNPRLIAAVNISAGTPTPGAKLKSYARKGARILKIHCAADGEEPESPRYKLLLKAADSLGIPVILHTGCFHSRLFFKNVAAAEARRFEPWFKEFPNVRFVLAHMNAHDPQAALDLAETYGNLWVDTSWQPAEIIGEAARRIGADRVLFGTDWPVIGHNLKVGVARVRECVKIGILSPEGAERILGKNAAQLLGIPPTQAETDASIA